MKKTVFFLCLLAFVSTFFALAQESSNAPVAAPVNDVPLNVKILQTNFDEATRQLTVKFSVVNTTGLFVDNLVYHLELFKGDALAKEGYLFAPLEFIVATSGSVEKLSPKETREIKISYVPPASLDSGNYFFRLGVNDKSTQIFGSDYTKTPLRLEGQGGFIGFLQGFFRNRYGDNSMIEGFATEKNETASLVFFLRDNQKLTKTLGQGQLYWEAKIYSVNFNNQLVKEIKKQPVVLSKETDGREIIKLDLVPWPDIKAGPYSVYFSLVDEKGDPLTDEMYARWMINGTFARINEIIDSKPFYSRGEKLDLAVGIVSELAKSGQQAVLSVEVFAKELTAPLKLEKEFVLEDTTLNFSDQAAPGRLTLQRIKASLKDKQNGEVLDEYQLEFKEFKATSWQEFLIYNREYVLILTAVIFLLAAFLLWLFLKKSRTGQIIFLMIIILMVAVLAASFFFLFTQRAQGQLAFSASRIYYSSAPNGNLGNCPQQGYYEFTVKVYCLDCLNGTNGYLRIYQNGSPYNQQSFASIYDSVCASSPGSGICLFGDRNAMFTSYFNGSSYGHDKPEHMEWVEGAQYYHVIDEGPFGYSVNANGSFYAQIQYTRSNYCLGNLYTSPTYSVSCTVLPVPANPTISASCPSPGTSGSVSWSAPAGTTYYAFRLNNLSNGWTSCDPAGQAGDFCGNTTANSYSFAGTPGVSYDAWVHACNSSGCSSGIGVPTFTCVPPNGTINGYVYINNCGSSYCNTCSRPGGQTVTVKSGGTTITTCPTDGAGYYSCSVPAGTYDVSVSTNAGETCSWGSKATPDYCLGTGCSQTVTVAAGAVTDKYFTVFPAPQTLTVTKAGTGSGTITPSTGSLSWSGNIGSASYSYNTSVVLNAALSAGSSLTSWSGCDSTSGNACTVAMTGAKNVTATFTLNTYTVTPSAGANGTISPNTPQTVGYNGTKSFTISPSAGYVSTVGGTCGGTLVGNTFTTDPVTANCTVAVTFSLGTVTLSCGATSQFSAGTYTINIPNIAGSLSADFELWGGGGGGGGDVGGGADVRGGAGGNSSISSLGLFANGGSGGSASSVTVSGGTASGGDSRDNGDSGIGRASCTSAGKGGNSGGSVLGAGGAGSCGTGCSAGPGGAPGGGGGGGYYGQDRDPSSCAGGGGGGGGYVKLSNSPATAGSAIALVVGVGGTKGSGMDNGGLGGAGLAKVKLNCALTLTVTKVGTGSGTLTSAPAGINCGATCSANYTYNTSVTLTATPSAGSTFTNWSGCDSTSGNTCTVAMSAAKNATANFGLSNQAPTPINLSVIQPDYCQFGPAITFNWTFSDPNAGDTQSAYQVQVASDAGFSGPGIISDSGKISNSSNAWVSNLGNPAKTKLYWRVQVWDNSGLSSGWVEYNDLTDPDGDGSSKTFTIPAHAYPTVDFTANPLFPSAGELVQLTDITVTSPGVNIVSWLWNIPDATFVGGTTANSQNPQIRFISNGLKNIVFTATDADGYSCSNTDSLSALQKLDVNFKLPGWKEE